MIAGALPLELSAANRAKAVAPAVAALAGAKDPSKKDPGKGNVDERDSGKNSSATKTPKLNAKQSQTLPVAYDPAYVAATLVSTFFTTFHSYLTTGEGGSIDWK